MRGFTDRVVRRRAYAASHELTGRGEGRPREAREAAEAQADAQAARKRRLIIFGGILAVAAAILLVVVLVSSGGEDKSSGTPEQVAAFDGIPQQGPWLGRADAPVVVEEYADLQCPFCAAFAKEQLPGFVKDYVRTGKVRMRLRLLTFIGPESVKAAEVAFGARQQDKLWQFAEAFYLEQGPENSGYVTDDFLRDVARTAGADPEAALNARGTPRPSGRSPRTRRPRPSSGWTAPRRSRSAGAAAN